MISQERSEIWAISGGATDLAMTRELQFERLVGGEVEVEGRRQERVVAVEGVVLRRRHLTGDQVVKRKPLGAAQHLNEITNRGMIECLKDVI